LGDSRVKPPSFVQGGPSLKENCFIHTERGGKENIYIYITIKPVAMRKIIVYLLISYFIFLSHFTTTVKKEKKKALLLHFFHTPQDVRKTAHLDPVQCEKKYNFIVIYLTSHSFYFFSFSFFLFYWLQ
jgi:hypothetical protein